MSVFSLLTEMNNAHHLIDGEFAFSINVLKFSLDDPERLDPHRFIQQSTSSKNARFTSDLFDAENKGVYDATESANDSHLVTGSACRSSLRLLRTFSKSSDSGPSASIQHRDQ
jgi:hypothetical protein